MNLYGSKQLVESIRTVRKNTILIAEDIPEKDYGYRPSALRKDPCNQSHRWFDIDYQWRTVRVPKPGNYNSRRRGAVEGSFRGRIQAIFRQSASLDIDRLHDQDANLN
jgi:hypothetical protein